MIRQNDGLGNVYIAPLFEFTVRLITSATKVIFGTEIKLSRNLMNCYWKYKTAARKMETQIYIESTIVMEHGCKQYCCEKNESSAFLCLYLLMASACRGKLSWMTNFA